MSKFAKDIRAAHIEQAFQAQVVASKRCKESSTNVATEMVGRNGQNISASSNPSLDSTYLTGSTGKRKALFEAAYHNAHREGRPVAKQYAHGDLNQEADGGPSEAKAAKVNACSKYIMPIQCSQAALIPDPIWDRAKRNVASIFAATKAKQQVNGSIENCANNFRNLKGLSMQSVRRCLTFEALQTETMQMLAAGHLTKASLSESRRFVGTMLASSASGSCPLPTPSGAARTRSRP